eukprot:5838470-Lingulodinium_polyedra.AAC.1
MSGHWASPVRCFALRSTSCRHGGSGPRSPRDLSRQAARLSARAVQMVLRPRAAFPLPRAVAFVARARVL